MSAFLLTQELLQIQTGMGGYHALRIPKAMVDTFSQKHKSRVRLVLDESVVVSCALKNGGIEDFYVFVSQRDIKKLRWKQGDLVNFSIEEHPHPLGVDVPEVLDVFLAQDSDAKAIFDTFTDGKKRSLVFSILRLKSVDKQIEKIQQFLTQEVLKKKGFRK